MVIHRYVAGSGPAGVQCPHRRPPTAFVTDPPGRHPLVPGALTPPQHLRAEPEHDEVAAGALDHGLADPGCGGDRGHGLTGITPRARIDPTRGTHRHAHGQEPGGRELIPTASHGGVVGVEGDGDVREPCRTPGPAGDTGVGALLRV
jgi:hypothetical protein